MELFRDYSLGDYMSSLYVNLISALNEKESQISKETDRLVLGGILSLPFIIICISLTYVFYIKRSRKKDRRVNQSPHST